MGSLIPVQTVQPCRIGDGGGPIRRPQEHADRHVLLPKTHWLAEDARYDPNSPQMRRCSQSMRPSADDNNINETRVGHMVQLSNSMTLTQRKTSLFDKRI